MVAVSCIWRTCPICNEQIYLICAMIVVVQEEGGMVTAVYIAPEVAEIFELHPYLSDVSFMAMSICEQVVLQSETVFRGFQAQDRRVGMHLLSWWPGAAGKTLDYIFQSEFSEEDALLTMSREYGFADFPAVEALAERRPCQAFEAALESMLEGDMTAFRSQLERAPGLVMARSRYGHEATLLHYLGANGVESHRQRVPMTAVEASKELIARGASKAAKAKMYGGGQTAYDLARTSAHPQSAGVLRELKQVLQPSEQC